MSDPEYVDIDYTNWHGERAVRRIIPLAKSIQFGATDWHPSPQWLFEAWDLEKNAYRTFAIKDIHSRTPVTASFSDKGGES